MTDISGTSKWQHCNLSILVVSDIIGSRAIATYLWYFAVLKSVAGVAETANVAETNQPAATVTFEHNEDVPDHPVIQPTNCSGGLNPLLIYL